MSTRRSSRTFTRPLSAAAGALALTTLITAACSRDSTSPSGPQTISGPSQPIGSGTMAGYATLDADGRVTSIGVALSDSALLNLPTTPPPGMPGTMYDIPLPQVAKAVGFDHVFLGWNPLGHDPVQVYGLPHFDFHFYKVSSATQGGISPADSQFAAKLAHRPADQFVPPSYMQLPGGIPFMGAHWVDTTSPELAPPPSNSVFTRTFMYGSYDGHFIFYEPMITKTEIEAARNRVPSIASLPIKVPASYETPGLYPTSYSIAYDASAKVYRIALDGLVSRQ
ncbi:MAG: DUF5602 domain-containing protein [bacterium]